MRYLPGRNVGNAFARYARVTPRWPSLDFSTRVSIVTFKAFSTATCTYVSKHMLKFERHSITNHVSKYVSKHVSTCDSTYVRPTLFVTADFGFAEANFTWNEIGLCDDQGTPNSPVGGSKMWARQIDSSPLVKDVSKRAIVECQLPL